MYIAKKIAAIFCGHILFFIINIKQNVFIGGYFFLLFLPMTYPVLNAVIHKPITATTSVIDIISIPPLQ